MSVPPKRRLKTATLWPLCVAFTRYRPYAPPQRPRITRFHRSDHHSPQAAKVKSLVNALAPKPEPVEGEPEPMEEDGAGASLSPSETSATAARAAEAETDFNAAAVRQWGMTKRSKLREEWFLRVGSRKRLQPQPLLASCADS